MALTKIEDKEIMTVWEASKKYADKYIMMIRVDEGNGGDTQKGYVVYVHDEHAERLQIPKDEMRQYLEGEGLVLFMQGVDAERYLQVGGIEIHANV